MRLHDLKPRPGAKHRTKRLGQGESSGHGKTSGRGGKGQTARSGSSIRIGFEGGQMPLIRRVPKRGFTNPFKVVAQVVNLKALAGLSGTEVTAERLAGAGLVAYADRPVKVLADGDAPPGLVLKGVAASAAAKAKIEAAGGRIEA
jgi:large subunit ribosomal protein L15